MLISPATTVVMDNEDLSGQARPRRTTPVTLEAGRGYPIRIEYVRSPDVNEFVSIGVRHPAGSIEEAVALARDADAVVLVVGSASATEGEGYDRADLGGRTNWRLRCWPPIRERWWC
jgi:beta-glucosidase